MAALAHTTPSCPRLSSNAPRFTTEEVLTILGDRPERKRPGTLRAIIVRTVGGLGIKPAGSLDFVGGRL